MAEETEQEETRPINAAETTTPEEASPGVGADSSAASSKGSRTGSGPFISDPGSAFDPENAPVGPELSPADADDLLAIEWEEEQVRRWLLLQGELGHGLVGVAENDWRYTEADLISIAGPLTRILNRYDTTRAAAAYSDPLSVTFGFGMYGVRSLGERRRAIAALRAAQEQEVPITGEPAPPGSGPPPDDDLQWKTN